MSLNYERWLATLYYSDTDIDTALYNSYGETSGGNMAGISETPIYISTINYQYTPTHETATDIAGRPYSRNRGFTDGWTLTTTPYYFDTSGSKYQTLQLVDNLMFAIKYRHLWIKISGGGVNALTNGITIPSGVAKVIFISFAESINNASSSRTANIQFQRKFRFD